MDASRSLYGKAASLGIDEAKRAVMTLAPNSRARPLAEHYRILGRQPDKSANTLGGGAAATPSAIPLIHLSADLAMQSEIARTGFSSQVGGCRCSCYLPCLGSLKGGEYFSLGRGVPIRDGGRQFANYLRMFLGEICAFPRVIFQIE